MTDGWARKDGESEYEFIYRICSAKEQIGSWQDVADFLNRELGYQYTECKYRKDFAAFKKMFSANRTRLVEPEGITADMEERELALKREARKFYDQRQALSRIVTVQARDEAMRDCVKQAADRLNQSFPMLIAPVKDAELDPATEAVLCLNDWHYGMTCNNIFNRFDVDVCRERVQVLLEETIRRLHLHRVSVLHILLLGDFAHGAIHTSARVESCEAVSDQLIHVSELIAELIHALSHEVDKVKVYATYGNHMRTVQNKKDSVHSDNMEKVIPWWLQARLAQNDRVRFCPSMYEFVLLSVCGENLCAVHGDLDTVRDFGVTTNTLFSRKFGITIDKAIMADKHHKEALDRLGIDNLIAPALCGTDGYANGKRLYANPSQLMAVFRPNYGLDACYYIKLDSKEG